MPIKTNAVRIYVNLVAKMLAAQRVYFKTRDKNVLEESKRLEREVKKATARMRNDLDQPGLFTED